MAQHTDLIKQEFVVNVVPDYATFLEMQNAGQVESDELYYVGGEAGGVVDHRQTTNRDAADQHPMSAITGLVAALAEKGTYTKPSSGIPASDLASEVTGKLLDPVSKTSTMTQAVGRDSAGRLYTTPASAGTTDHSQLSNRDAADQHPMSAITGLAAALAAIPTKTSDLTNDSGYITNAALTDITSDITGIKAKIPSQASATNKLVSASEMGDAIAAVEAKQLYSSAQQAQFATKAALLSATTFYNADGTTATPTKNDVAYVLADETHSGKSAKYVIAAVSGSSITWGFVIAFTDTALTQTQMDAVNSGITEAKVSAYDTHTGNTGIHVTSSDKTEWNGKYTKPSSGIPESDLASAVTAKLVSPVSKTSDMTQAVGRDTDGRLYTIPGSGGSGGTTDHSALSNRDLNDQHPMSAITGLVAALAAKGTYTKPSSGIPASDLASEVTGKLLSPVTKTSAMTQAVGRDSAGQLYTAPGGTTDHSALTNRDAADQHPMSAITGLTAALNAKGTYTKPTSGIPESDLSSAVAAKLVSPVSKTSAMTQAVGKDTDGKLYTTPAASPAWSSVTDKPFSTIGSTLKTDGGELNVNITMTLNSAGGYTLSIG